MADIELRELEDGGDRLDIVEGQAVAGMGLDPVLDGERGGVGDAAKLGRAEVKDVFPAGKRDKAAGLLVLEGVIRKGLHARLTRDDVIVSKTTISSLRRFKDDVAEVRAGMECGVLLADTNDIKAGDNLEVFEVEERARTL